WQRYVAQSLEKLFKWLSIFNNNKSRFLTEFEEIKVLIFVGEGAFGVVVSSKNRIDKKTYVVKKVKIDYLVVMLFLVEVVVSLHLFLGLLC
ncbi:unnamed protein product, partial [Prunus brigantina]